MKKKVLFVTYGGGHVNLLLTVIIEIKKNLKVESTILGLSIAVKVLSQYNIDYEENILRGVESILNSKNLRCEMEKNSRKYF